MGGNFMAFADTNARVKIDFPDDNWVILKKELTGADQEAIAEDIIGIELDSGKGLTDVKLRTVKMRTGNITLLARAVVDWSFVGPDGKKAEINRESIGRLKPDIYNSLVKEVRRHSPLSTSDLMMQYQT